MNKPATPLTEAYLRQHPDGFGMAPFCRTLEKDRAKLVEQAKLYLTLQKRYIEEAGPCDHAVNICVCGLIAEAEETASILRELGELP